MRGIITCIFVALLLPGCATLSRNECLTADWRTIGYEDGLHGQSRDMIGSHQQACAEYGVTPDLTGYQQGYDQGILIFCTPSNGFAKGKSGSAYDGICPAEAEGKFLRGYRAGKKIFTQTTRSSELASDLRDIYHRLEEIEDTISKNEQDLLTDSIEQDTRRKVHRTIKRLKERQNHLERRYYHLQDEKNDVDHDLSRLRRKYREYE